uniref:2-iminobutanoate/2-iminopropanoate deaminase n=1 Tax=Heterorhabditis bacteriophora TaxID=37862 RepID=A0A1I7X783_HETBA
MVWAAFNRNGPLHIIESITDSIYCVRILEDNLLLYVRSQRLGRNWIFQQDNDPKHSSNATKRWFHRNEITKMEWQLQNPDLNPIAPVKRCRERVIKKAWAQIPLQRYASLIDSMPRHCAAVTTNFGQAVRVENTIYLSGSLGMDPLTGQLSDGIKGQTHQSLKNIGEVLKAAGVGYGNVVKTTVLLADINDFATVNDIYKEYFIKNFPARAAYQVAVLPKNALVEIEAIAVVGEIQDLTK